jgi:hypothetical protein
MLAFFAQNYANFYKNLFITLVFAKIAIFRRKLAKIAENYDHNSDSLFLPKNVINGSPWILLLSWLHLQSVQALSHRLPIRLMIAIHTKTI